MSLQIILVNGPKGSGKSTLTKYLMERLIPIAKEFSIRRPEKDIALVSLGLPYMTQEQFEQERYKHRYHGLTLDDHMHRAQQYLRECFGVGHQALLACDYIHTSAQVNKVFIVQDVRYNFELEAFVKVFGHARISVVQLVRDNVAFDKPGESQYGHPHYVYVEGVKGIYVPNKTGDLKALKEFADMYADVIRRRATGA